MYVYNLIKGLSFSGGGYTVTKARPIVLVEKEEDKEYLLGTGYFEEVKIEDVVKDEIDTPFIDDIEEDKEEPKVTIPFEPIPLKEDEENDEVNLDDMKMAELVTYAKEKGIDISSAKNNEQRRALIRAAL